METWYAVYIKATGRLVATGTSLGNVPDYMDVLTLDYNPQDGYLWNETTRNFEVLPPQVRVRTPIEQLDDLTSVEFELLLQRGGVTPARRDELRTAPTGGLLRSDKDGK